MGVTVLRLTRRSMVEDQWDALSRACQILAGSDDISVIEYPEAVDVVAEAFGIFKERVVKPIQERGPTIVECSFPDEPMAALAMALEHLRIPLIAPVYVREVGPSGEWLWAACPVYQRIRVRLERQSLKGDAGCAERR